MKMSFILDNDGNEIPAYYKQYSCSQGYIQVQHGDCELPGPDLHSWRVYAQSKTHAGLSGNLVLIADNYCGCNDDDF